MAGTAIEWYAARIHDIEFKKSIGAISVIEYYEELTNALEQAKKMEKEQMELIYEGLIQNVDTCIKQSDLQTFEQYYNETFKQQGQ
jgi:phosphosulfolactate phosphohydrolase-like enzyme